MKMVANYRGARQLMKWSHSKAVTHKIDIVEEDYFYRNKLEKIRKLYRKHISLSVLGFNRYRRGPETCNRRKRPKVDTLFSCFFRRIRATSMTQHRV